MNYKLILQASEIDLQKLSLMYKETSLGERPVEKLKLGISHCAKIVVLEKDGHYVGAGRTISDGIHTLIVDLAVIPAFKGQGYGKLIFDEILKGEDKKFVYLNSTWEAEGFYKKQGFKKQKTGYARYPFATDYLE